VAGVFVYAFRIIYDDKDLSCPVEVLALWQSAAALLD
jgi:hypothetical protein